MRRMVIGLVVAAIMFMPAGGTAAPLKKGVVSASWWQTIVIWVSQAVSIEKSQTIPPASSPDTTVPNDNIDAGSTVDPFG